MKVFSLSIISLTNISSTIKSGTILCELPGLGCFGTVHKTEPVLGKYLNVVFQNTFVPLEGA